MIPHDGLASGMELWSACGCRILKIPKIPKLQFSKATVGQLFSSVELPSAEIW